MVDSPRISLVNNTNYFNPASSKLVNSFLSPKTYHFKKSKQEGIETRLYYEFENVRKLGGQTFYYTLTYTDSKLPRFEGVPCFDYTHIIGFLNGALKQRLLRDYGISYKYFVGAEFGEGAGSRGLENNPHYHVLLFTRPSPFSDFYKPIPVSEMRHYVKLYWQGFDENDTGYRDYRTCKYGIAKESEKGDLLTDFSACIYCAKYVTKDVHFYKSESIIRKRLKERYYKILYSSQLVQNNFFIDYMIPRFGIDIDDLPTKCDWYWSCSDLISALCPKLVSLTGERIMQDNYLAFFNKILTEAGLLPQYKEYVDNLVADRVKEQINLWRNRYSNKYRISNGVGISALDDIDERTMTIKMPDKSGFKMRPIPLYYFRKLCCDVVKDALGNNKYILNDVGIKYQLDSIDHRIDKLFNNTKSYVQCFDYNIYEQSKFLYPSSLSFTDLLSKLSDDTLIHRYSLFKTIYEYRFYPKYDLFPEIDYKKDYLRFISSRMDVDYCPNGSIDFSKSGFSGYLPYSQHPYFSNYVYYFQLYDFLNDYFFLNKDNRAKIEQEDRYRLVKFHKQQNVKQYFNNFKNVRM